MEKRFSQSLPEIENYLYQAFRPEDATLKTIREESAKRGLPQIQVGAMDGLHLEVLTRLTGVSRALEIGTLGGYSGVCIARGLRERGVLHTCEIAPHHAEVARKHFELAGVSAKINLHVGAAKNLLPGLEKEGPFDLVFIDADKEGYPAYAHWAMKNVRKGGIILGDNTLGFGRIADEKIEDPQTLKAVTSIREFNRILAESSDFRTTLFPTGEGLTLAIRIQ